MLDKAIVDYWHQQQQQPWSNSNLNNSDCCRKMEQDDIQMMLPGLVGEDPEGLGWRQRQKEQLREWLNQQQTEQKAERHQQMLEGQPYSA